MDQTFKRLWSTVSTKLLKTLKKIILYMQEMLVHGFAVKIKELVPLFGSA